MGGTEYQSIQAHHNEEAEENSVAEEEPKVSTLELFSDLVIVVSIHVVAEPLEEPEFSEYGLYLARVFYLWLAWHMMTLFMNAAVKMKSNNCPFHNFFIFLWMACILHMSQAFSIDDDKTAVKWYLGIRTFEFLIHFRQISFPYMAFTLEDGTKAMSVSNEWLDAMTKYLPVMFFSLICCEIIPLSLAIYYGHHHELYYPMVYASISLILVSFFIGAAGGIGNRGKMLVNAFDADHLSERYELISLIFTGELCFAAGTPGNSIGCNGVLFMAFAAYLLAFKSFPLNGYVKFWARSILHSVAGLFLYAGVFCAIPAMGSAFSRIIKGDEEKEEVEAQEEEGGGEEGEETFTISAGDLLCYSAGAYMVFTAMINLINTDASHGTDKPKISSMNRGLIRISAGLLIWALSFLVPEEVEVGGAPISAIFVPFLALLSTSIEIWAVGSLKIAI